MSSNIRIEKTCEWCGNKFIAQTTVTRFCSKRCSEHAYKERLRQQKIQITQSVPTPNLSAIKAKEYLSVAETAQLLDMTRQGVYKLIHRSDLEASKISSRLTLIKRQSIDLMLDKKPYQKREATEKKAKTLEDFYTRADIREKYGVKDSWIYKVVAENNVPKTIIRGKAYFSKSHIDRLFSARKENPEITEWYSVEDIQSKYGMTLSAIYSLVSKVGIPKRKEGSKVYYSKYHFDVAKGAKSAEDVEFISVAEAMAKYSLTRDQLYHYVKTYKITKLRYGKYVKLNAKELEELFNPKIQFIIRLFFSPDNHLQIKNILIQNNISMESATITKVTLRMEKLRSGKLSLYLDFYPPIWNPHIKKMSRREFLGLYLYAQPRDQFETSYNEEILLKARGICAMRELSIINEEFGFLDRTKKQADFLEYFNQKAKSKYQKWEIVHKHFSDFCNGRCLVKDVTVGLCNDFRTHILKLKVKQKDYQPISRNSAAGYWSTFRAFLKIAYKEGYLKENINDHLEAIEWEDPKIEYLEIEEVKKLAATPCKVDVLKRASLFTCLTGLRISDILQLKWENIERSPEGGHCMRIRTQKTKTQATLPLSEEALSFCGESERGLVFKGLSRAHTRQPFKKWLKDAGITKKITFHGLRHTYATLLITNGTDIYTVSKMLTHKSVATTQIYADVVNQKKRAAANSISLK